MVREGKWKARAAISSDDPHHRRLRNEASGMMDRGREGENGTVHGQKLRRGTKNHPALVAC